MNTIKGFFGGEASSVGGNNLNLVFLLPRPLMEITHRPSETKGSYWAELSVNI